ncbi:MAG: acyloxyacyl hydrolase [Planctomycetota bacterium]|mgnify:CR=1 FL=1
MKKLVLLTMLAAASPAIAGTEAYGFQYAPQGVERALPRAFPAIIPLAADVVQPAAPAAGTPVESVPGKKVFGSPDSGWWWTLGGGVASNLGKDTDVNLRASATTFIARNVQIGAELGLWYIGQSGTDRAGINPNFVLRYHAYNDNDWTIFLDTGMGLGFMTGKVPQAGTSFNLMPRVGIGFTKAIGTGDSRLEFGLRWHHISNARIYGDSRNPSRDLPMIHFGIVFPF